MLRIENNMEPVFCTPESNVVIYEDCKIYENIRILNDLDYPVKLYTAIRGRWQYKDVSLENGDNLTLSIDSDWYETSVGVLKGQKLVGHIAREIARPVANFLKFNGRIFPELYCEIGGRRNQTVWSLRAGGLEIGVILYFDCKSSTEAKDLERHFREHACHYVPQMTKQNCPEELKFMFGCI